MVLRDNSLKNSSDELSNLKSFKHYVAFIIEHHYTRVASHVDKLKQYLKELKTQVMLGFVGIFPTLEDTYFS